MRSRETMEVDFVDPPGEKVLEVAADILFSGERCGLSVPGSPVHAAEGHSTVLDRQDAAVADCSAAHAAPEDLENGFAALNGRLGVDHPHFFQMDWVLRRT